jgi:hypothetical protein
MKAHVQFGLLKLADPRMVRVLLLGLTLALVLLGQAGIVCAGPCSDSGSCGGG